MRWNIERALQEKVGYIIFKDLNPPFIENLSQFLKFYDF